MNAFVGTNEVHLRSSTPTSHEWTSDDTDGDGVMIGRLGLLVIVVAVAALFLSL